MCKTNFSQNYFRFINLVENSSLEKLLRVRLLRVNANTIQQWMTSNDKVAPLLNQSLKMLDVLEELAHLPSILHLQEYLLTKFSGKISRTETEGISISDFSAKINDEYKQNFFNLVERLLKTWDKIKDKVMESGGVLADDLGKLDCYNFPVNPVNTPASFLFPAYKGPGLCSYLLVHFLIDIHNQTVKSELPPIDPYKATIGHLVTVSRADITTLLLAHTSYSIAGRGTTTEVYDIEGMERKMVYR